MTSHHPTTRPLDPCVEDVEGGLVPALDALELYPVGLGEVLIQPCGRHNVRGPLRFVGIGQARQVVSSCPGLLLQLQRGS